MHWQDVAVGYLSYLAVVSLARREYAKARAPLFIAAAAAWGVVVVLGRAALSPALEVILPSLILLIGYWLSGLLFVRPDPRFERWLLAADEIVLTDIYAASEEPIPGITLEVLADTVRRGSGRTVHVVPSIDEVIPRVLQLTRAGDAVMTLGAGSIGSVPRKLMDALRRQEAGR